MIVKKEGFTERVDIAPFFLHRMLTLFNKALATRAYSGKLFGKHREHAVENKGIAICYHSF